MSPPWAQMLETFATFNKKSKHILLDKHLVDFANTTINRPDMKGELDVFNRVMPRDDIAVKIFLESCATGARLIVSKAHIFWNENFVDVKLVRVAILMEQITKDTIEQLRSNGFLTAFDENLIFGPPSKPFHGDTDHLLRPIRSPCYAATPRVVSSAMMGTAYSREFHGEDCLRKRFELIGKKLKGVPIIAQQTGAERMSNRAGTRVSSMEPAAPGSSSKASVDQPADAERGVQ
ncbi:hypothetical protein BU16DRAFT_566096 [Lophium mytilinum]|uniref:Uncharacterized protein n=1 Tax=Lophium mytilinum TaxID=390894 RepID=A0A6A6QFX9_9PEZI|nr:hypothetical protein BU16DRAFT_566096 [Lophium mytilinum]